MGSLVPDGEVEEPFILEAIFEKVVDTVNVDFLFHLQLVIIREVERNRHVGLPHAALHVVHGKGVGGAFFKIDCFAFVVELNWNFASIFRRLIFHLKCRACSNVFL